ncbi:MAG: energy-coupling factor transporter transmembrane protein EcfT [Anaerolineales bacterium]|nr:energy-coupling factor transporter transmembrane protein EcfT [Anaerolineales bacterium]
MLAAWRYRKRENSLIQSFDPRAWIIFFVCFLISVLSFWDVRFLLPFLTIAFFAVFTSRVTWVEMRRAFLFIVSFVLFYAFLTFLTGRGGMEVYAQERTLREFTAGFSIFGWTPTLKITVERIFFAASQLVRISSIALMTILIPYSLNPALYGITFKRLGLSDKFAYAMDLTMRFIPTFGRDFQLTMDAQRARGYELEKLQGGLIGQVRKLGPIVVPVVIHAIMGSEDIIDAMDLRAFGVAPRTWFDELTYQKRDRVLMALGALILIVSLGLAMMGYGKFWTP